MCLPVATIHGILNQSNLSSILEDIRLVASQDSGATFYLTINSRGGDIIPTIDFIKQAEMTRLRFAIKIYTAMSAAAFLAFSLADSQNIEISTTAHVSFHMGQITVDASDLTLDGKIPAKSRLSLLCYNQDLKRLMSKLRLDTDRNLMAELTGSGFMNINPNELFERGLVHRLFLHDKSSRFMFMS